MGKKYQRLTIIKAQWVIELMEQAKKRGMTTIEYIKMCYDFFVAAKGG